jgi:DNA-binding response OmpR family regulator
MNILIIEPDYILAKEYKNAFDQAGFVANVSYDAQSAIAAVDKLSPVAIILELQLAGHSGVEFLHEFRSYDDWSKIPVFIYSRLPEYLFKVEPSTWLAFGVQRYFYKPKVPLNRLIGVVKKVVSST